MTSKDRWYIRVLRESGMTLKALGKAFGVTKQAVHFALAYSPVPRQTVPAGAQSDKVKLRVRRVRAKLCAECGKKAPTKGRTLCGKCRARNRARYYLRKATPPDLFHSPSQTKYDLL